MTEDYAHLDAEELRRRLEECESTLAAIRNGEVDAVVVSDQSTAKVYTLEGADHPYRVLVEAMRQGAATLSSDGSIVYCNYGMADMMKRPYESIVGTDICNYFVAEQRLEVQDFLEASRIQSRQREFRILAADDSELPVLASCFMLQLPNAEALCVIFTDLTEHQQNEELKDTDRRKDEFLAMLAHELRNPLAPISNAVSMLCLINDDANPDAKWACEVIDRQVSQMKRIVDDLLDISRITRGKINLKMEPIDVATIVSQAIETSRPLIEARRHQLHIELAPDPLRVEGDAIRLTQVLTNLLNNAAKYTEEGGEIWLAVKRDDDEVALSVRDNGVGISTDLLPTIFDLFTQADRSIDRSQGGLGIGLTLVRRLVQMHGGTVAAESGGGSPGSEFIVRLPLVPIASELAADGDSSASAEPAASQRRIMVVDDNVDSALSLAKLLKAIGNKIEVAHDGPAALELAESFRPEVVFLDIGLPSMNGYMVAERLRSQPGGGDLCLAALTGYGEEQDRVRAMEHGFDYHLVKPVDFKALQSLLETLTAAE